MNGPFAPARVHGRHLFAANDPADRSLAASFAGEMDDRADDCPECDGTGEGWFDAPCAGCRGTGILRAPGNPEPF
ncbi:MAG: hypothetical protein JWQ72_1607 [Polaromonas sp.]|nr:hypothetical protein [Polaromonas sp.]